MENNSRDVINQISAVKRNINDIMRDRLYIKDFAPKLMQNIYEADDLLENFNVEILLVNIFFYFREIRFP